ncbi:UNVERIFIED_CONTAM: hypothetical protein PYX00_008809 [Menopon gallinae]|uniref:Non-homologous end-joining factor 1 n=1 Tax=Menopon gallinae TaxID=328185 RepID=A0AAW2HPT2_9NEOP
MWTSLSLDNLILKWKKTEFGCNVHVSDFIHIWSLNLKNEEIEVIFKSMNPLIEAPTVKIVDTVLSLFEKIKSISKAYQIKDDILTLHLESDLFGVHFQFELHLKQQNAEMLFQELLLPMITVAATLQLRENKLIEIITRKDAEINEYKRENTPIKRNHLITKKFNADRFKERGFAENDSSVSAVESNPSLIFDLIDIKLFSSFMDSDINNSNVDKKNINENLEAECIITNSNAISSHNSANDKEEDLIGL